MCKNTDKPCAGCKKHKKVDAAWLFFTDEERRAAESSSKAPTLADAHS